VPSFFETIGRIVSGKPAFTPEDNLKKRNNAQMGESSMTYGANPLKKAEITDVDCVEGGAGLECWITIQNSSNDKLDLNQFEFLGKQTDLQTIVNPGERRRFMAYQGPHLQNPGPNECNVEYIDSSGNYFVANHNVIFRQVGDGTHEVDRINFVQIWDKK
jgi:hypothetical protein